MSGLPVSGEASTYSDFFVGKLTSNGEIYRHESYSAALLPKARWYVVPMGTLLSLTYNGKTVIVRVNDRGIGNGSMDRVLDLSRAAYAYLAGQPITAVSDQTAGLIQLQSIKVAPAGTGVGPVKP